MAHGPRKTASKTGGKKKGRRLVTKRLRRADAQALAGGHSRLVRPDKDGKRPQTPLLPEE